MGLEIKVHDLGDIELESAIRKTAQSRRFVLPMHGRPGLVERTRVTGRLLESVPGPVIPIKQYPGPATAEIDVWQAQASREPLRA